MMQQLLSRIWLGALAIFFIIGLASCGSSRKSYRDLLYLQGNLDTVSNQTIPIKEMIIQPGDLLSIVVYSDNPEATVIYNQQQMASQVSGGGASGSSAIGYLVDERGNIQFQKFGSMHVAGLTKLQLAQQLSDKLSFYLTNPYLSIRFLNFRFTVIGEVNKPGVYTVPQEKLSILEMLGLAGDLTVYGRRDNILVIREKDGERKLTKIDIRSPSIFQSPYFYLQQNDVIVVEANPKKPTVNDQALTRNLTIATGIASLLSTIAILVNIFK